MNKKIKDLIKILSDYNTNENEINYLVERSLNSQTEMGRIGYNLFLEKDKRYNRSTFHIAINANANALSTVLYIKKIEKDLFKIDTFIYILRKKGKNSHMKESILDLFKNATFKPNSVDFIGDIIKKISQNRSSIDFTQNKYILPEALIENPSVKELEYCLNEKKIFTKKEEKITINYITNWLNNSAKPILLILGKGGVGKTTIAEYISNKILDDNKYVSNIFINSVHLKNRLNIEASQSTVSIGLYDVYKYSIENQNILDEYYFGRNLDCNNFFIILDGIDELISKVGLFESKSFIKSILRYNDDIHGLKIIITCRIEYWDYFTNENMQIVELKAFDKAQMENFFLKNFAKDSRNFRRAIELTLKFHKINIEKTEPNIYQPYALDLIVSFFKDKMNLGKINRNLSSERLNLNIDTDFIIVNICERERNLEGKRRVTNLSIDEQVKVLEYIAIYDGSISLSDLKDAIEFGINKNIKREQKMDYKAIAKSFKSFPLLIEDGNYISFKFDFHADIFRATYLAQSLNMENLNNEIKNEYLYFLTEFKFKSEIIENICNRISKWNDRQKINIQELISIIKDENDKEKRTQLLSGIFNLAFHLNSKFSRSGYQNKVENSKLIKDLFINKNRIKYLVLSNIEDNVYFDFSEVEIFENCVFNSYKSFWSTNNNWRSDVQFINCEFANLGIRSTKGRLSWSLDNNYTNFDINSQKNMDREFEVQFQTVRDEEIVLKEQIEKHVKDFVRFFWFSGFFKAQNLDIRDSKCRVPLNIKYSKFSTINLSMQEFLKICEDFNFIEYENYNKTILKINVNRQYRWKLKQYIQLNYKPEIVIKIEDKLFEIIA